MYTKYKLVCDTKFFQLYGLFKTFGIPPLFFLKSEMVSSSFPNTVLSPIGNRFRWCVCTRIGCRSDDKDDSWRHITLNNILTEYDLIL